MRAEYTHISQYKFRDFVVQKTLYHVYFMCSTICARYKELQNESRLISYRTECTDSKKSLNIGIKIENSVSLSAIIY